MKNNKMLLVIIATVTLVLLTWGVHQLRDTKSKNIPKGDLLQTLSISDAEFLKPGIQKIHGPCLVLFIASWCPHCKDILTELKNTHLPVFIILYHDKNPITEEQKAIATGVFRDISLTISPKWHVKSIPSVFVVNTDGEVVKKFDGSFRTKNKVNFMAAVEAVKNDKQ
tara:strand:- start:8516 stop:9019 length:504 start_codon:yes stop_codon:yes gene_type:complete